MNTFWDLGYNASTVDVLSEATGLGKSSFYNTFGSKEALFLEALDQYANQEIRYGITLLMLPGTPREKIEKYLLAAIIEPASQLDRRGCLLCNTAVELYGKNEAIGELVRNHFEPLKQIMADIVVKDGDLVGAEHHANQLLAIYMGLQVMVRGGYPIETLTQIVNFTLEQVPA